MHVAIRVTCFLTIRINLEVSLATIFFKKVLRMALKGSNSSESNALKLRHYDIFFEIQWFY